MIRCQCMDNIRKFVDSHLTHIVIIKTTLSTFFQLSKYRFIAVQAHLAFVNKYKDRSSGTCICQKSCTFAV